MTDKTLSKEEKFQIIAQMMTNHHHLCPEIFDKDKQLLPVVHNKILDIVEFIKKEQLILFPKLNILDVTLNGSLCSHVYSTSSDIDLFVIVDDIVPDNIPLSQELLDKINKMLSSITCKPFFYTHPVDFGVLHYSNKRVKNFNSYSVLNACWKQEPVYQEFTFTAEDLYTEYCKYSKNLHQFVAALDKDEHNFLTPQSCQNLSDYLQNLRDEAFHAKENTSKHEYSFEYNLYRLLKKFGAYSHFQNYLQDSYKNNIRRSE